MTASDPGAFSSLLDGVVNFLINGVTGASWWQVVLIALLLTHITIASVTIYLHRHSAHRSLDLHPIAAHFFRFWLWMTTGMVTKEWTAIHRKHHAKCEQEGDPHSPHIFGIKKVFWEGAELYRAEAKNADTMARYGHNTPDDWIERNVYSRFSALGVSLMLILDVALFGALGLMVWAIQMIWIPLTAAGIINGIGHWWGYRNFEAVDGSTNVSPWGILIGGEELHNNHHTYPTSAKLSVKPYEFDIGWMYISILQSLGLATVKKVPPKMAFGEVRPVADEKTLEAIIANRYEVMAGYAREMRQACKAELAALKARQADASVLKAAKRWLHRDDDKVPAAVKPHLAQARADHPVLDKMVTMREELRALWSCTNSTREQLAADLQAWCRRAEESGIAALRDFSIRLRSAHA
ncbi:MAG: acyl-CoA desaturase [Hydrogenophaga sp.]|uniref:DesA family fatty acid desaturase n=1 Tax=Hydrogenophaga sp. TaxID=1904254 RepID=UPI001690A524|nr:fatty acid desaturase [Hydrogenophaga sp.]NIM42307.1 acyl-CoA desaturase [Hydrogenophaga sp.]NIN28039.1 acyl-CoA desaturase [Hydrogenophaga sp.]NIN32817.1 acyl-CoA desaturase [Hydrogenophaga sp.]NIN54706.1 acyl-CoA desaturase [Hydrogenophaga sp.]NIO51382.1 acyl-CoA desaturase [Hydrogenophaga sp.]